MPVLVHVFCSVAFCIYRHDCQYLSCPLMCPLFVRSCLFLLCGFPVLTGGHSCKISLSKVSSILWWLLYKFSAHRGVFESSSLFIVSLVGHWTLHHCVPFCLERWSVCRQLFKGSIDLSLVARSSSPEQPLKKTIKVQVKRNVFKAAGVKFVLQNRIKYDN